jgi:phospholipid-binding lipoprotein MlaA
LLPLLALAVASCASQRGDVANDPYEPINRRIFAFNDALDRYAVRPVAVAYRDTVPDPLRDRVTNVLRNLNTPVILINELLQGDVEGAEVAAARLFINSTIGLGGLHDVAGMDKRLAYREEDFGQTLAVWGVDSGPYLVIPFLGPSNPRDFTGRMVDSFGDPVRIALGPVADVDAFGPSRLGGTIIDSRSRTVDITDEIRRSSVDFYAAIRSLYQQSREAAIADGAVEPDIEIPVYDLPEEEAPPPSDIAPGGGVSDAAPGAAAGSVAELPEAVPAGVVAERDMMRRLLEIRRQELVR